MQREVDVDLARVGPHRAHRVGAEHVAALGGQLAPLAVPVLTVGEVGESARGNRQHDLDPLVETGRAEPRELVARERHPREVRRQPIDASHVRVEAAVGRALARRRFDW